MAYTGDELQKIMREHILSTQLLSDSMTITAADVPCAYTKTNKSSKLKTKLKQFFSKILHVKSKPNLLMSGTEEAKGVTGKALTQSNQDAALTNGSFDRSKKLQRHLALCQDAPCSSAAASNAPLGTLQLLPQNGVKLKTTAAVSCPNVVCHTAILQLLQSQLANMRVLHSIRTLRKARVLCCPTVQPQTKVNILRATYMCSSWQKLKPLLCISYELPIKPCGCRKDGTADACSSTTYNTTTATQYIKTGNAAQDYESEIIGLLHNLLETQPNNSNTQQQESETLTPEASPNVDATVERYGPQRGIRLLLMPITGHLRTD